MPGTQPSASAEPAAARSVAERDRGDGGDGGRGFAPPIDPGLRLVELRRERLLELAAPGKPRRIVKGKLGILRIGGEERTGDDGVDFSLSQRHAEMPGGPSDMVAGR